MHDNLAAAAQADATVTRGAGLGDVLEAEGFYVFECRDAEGNLKWRDVAPNTVPNQGKNAILDNALGAGTGPTYYMSLITAGSASSSSTYASPTVTETTSSIIAARVAMGWASASAGSKSATTTSFSIIGSATITGGMVVSGGSGVATVGNTAASGGVLLSAANFSGGSKTVASGDTINVTYSLAI